MTVSATPAPTKALLFLKYLTERGLVTDWPTGSAETRKAEWGPECPVCGTFCQMRHVQLNRKEMK